MCFLLAGCVGGPSGPTDVAIEVVNETNEPWIVDVAITDADGAELADRTYGFAGKGTQRDPDNVTVPGGRADVDAHAHYESRSEGTQQSRSMRAEASWTLPEGAASLRVVVESGRVVLRLA